MASDPRTNAERVRQNEETFAKANERIRASAEQYEFHDPVPFLCECSRLTCTETIRLSLSDYRKARDRGEAFVLLPGHDDPHVERIVARGDGYMVVEKFS
jgi:hypothetical protein